MGCAAPDNSTGRATLPAITAPACPPASPANAPLAFPPQPGLQIFQAAQRELPGLEEDIAAGKFDRLKAWLNEKVHK